jgi:hypothetical protein
MIRLNDVVVRRLTGGSPYTAANAGRIMFDRCTSLLVNAYGNVYVNLMWQSLPRLVSSILISVRC